MYDRKLKSFRTFTVEYGADGIGSLKVQARSSLEAALIFMEQKPGVLMHDVRDSFQ